MWERETECCVWLLFFVFYWFGVFMMFSALINRVLYSHIWSGELNYSQFFLLLTTLDFLSFFFYFLFSCSASWDFINIQLGNLKVFYHYVMFVISVELRLGCCWALFWISLMPYWKVQLMVEIKLCTSKNNYERKNYNQHGHCCWNRSPQCYHNGRLSCGGAGHIWGFDKDQVSCKWSPLH